MRCLTVIVVEEWASLWSGPDGEGDESRDPTTLLAEGHSISLYELSQHAGSEPFEFDYVDGCGTAADREVSELGGFKGVTLDKWLSLAREPA